MNELAQGESYCVEYKRERPTDSKKYLKTVVAFANGIEGARHRLGAIGDGLLARRNRSEATESGVHQVMKSSSIESAEVVDRQNAPQGYRVALL